METGTNNTKARDSMGAVKCKLGVGRSSIYPTSNLQRGEKALEIKLVTGD
jgi:hypothetical protein